MSDETYDVIVIGAGPAGENAADRAHRGGLSVCLVERHLFGGECSYFACIPSKALLRPVSLRTATTRVRGVNPASIDVAGVLARRDGMIADLNDDGQVAWAEGAGLTAVRGHGRITGPRHVAVSTDAGPRELTATAAVVVATGSSAAVPDIPGLRDAQPWTNREATTSPTVPGRLVVLGGGVVGCELAQAYAGLGSAVTLVARGGLLARTESFAGELVLEGLRESGVDVRVDTEVTAVHRADPGGEVRVSLGDGSTIVSDEVLAALGRRPATSDLGLDSVGLQAGRSIDVDDSLRAVGVDGGWLYAVGDANGRNLLTHMGKYQGRVCGDVIAARARGATDDLPHLHATADAVGAPQVIFTDPEVAAVGRTSERARDAGLDVDVVDVEMSSAAGAGQLADGYRGAARLVVDRSRRVLVGATFVGQDSAELVHAATVAIIGGVTIDQLWHAVPSFPTLSEVWLRLLEAYGL